MVLPVWDNIMTATEASIKLGKNPKYIYMLWRRNSSDLLKNSVQLKGSTLLITREGYEHLEQLLKKESDPAINRGNSKVFNEVLVHF